MPAVKFGDLVAQRKRRNERLLDMGLTSEYVAGRASGHVARGPDIRGGAHEISRAGWVSASQEVVKHGWQVEPARRDVSEHRSLGPLLGGMYRG